MAVNLVVTTADKRLGQKSAETCRTPSQHSDPRNMDSMIDAKVPALATELVLHQSPEMCSSIRDYYSLSDSPG